MLESRLFLEGVRVIEFCQVAAGPFCGMLLADLGADVIKIENPATGDSLRQWPPITEGFSENFASLNRNKRSVALDLKNQDQHRIAFELCATADVIIENNRPGVMTRLGLDYTAISKTNPAVVYCSISGFGQSGPRARQGAFDVTAQAISGVMSVTGEPDGPPVKCGVPISDFSTGLYAALAVASALRSASRSNKGAHIDISLLGATLGVAALQTSEYFGTGNPPKKLGAAHPRNAPYEAFRSADGWFVMAAGNNKLWESVCRSIDMAELLDDPRFLSNSKRAAAQKELRTILEERFKTQPSSYWIDIFLSVGVPCGPINSYDQALDEPQVRASGWVKDLKLPSGRLTRTFGSPLLIDGSTLPITRPAPELGQHTEEILSELRRRSPIKAGGA
jgi:crotonobetainyl-CoA:carnitine CoA-transferase CaiB-like acyl-CoA transferase